VKRSVRLAVAVAMLAAGTLAAADLPSDSLYRLAPKLVDQDERPTSLDRYRGSPVLVAMFYTSCTAMCPLLMKAVQRIESALAEAERRRVRVLLVSLDPARDTPQALKAAALRYGADPGRWTLARASDADVRRIAAALGVQYRATPGGEINHSSPITLLDGEGRIVAQTSALASLDPAFLDRVRASIDSPR
jgi:protein SCO1